MNKFKLKIVQQILRGSRVFAQKETDFALERIADALATPRAIKIIRQQYMAEGFSICSNPSCTVRQPLKKYQNKYYCVPHYEGYNAKEKAEEKKLQAAKN